MQIDRASAIKLGSFAGVTVVAGACHYLGLGEHAVGLLGTVLALAGAGAHALFGHLGVHLIEKIAEHPDSTERARGVQNKDLHRLMGETIARIVERAATGAPGDKWGREYLRCAVAAFRNNWLTVELTGTERDVGEARIQAYFTGDVESIKKAPVLEHAEWFALVEVAGKATFREYDQALSFAAEKLRERFALELWEAAKDAWNTGDLAWPALILRLLSLILGYEVKAAASSEETVKQLNELRSEIKTLKDAIGKAAADAEAKIAPDQLPAHEEMLGAIRDYQYDLSSSLDRIEGADCRALQRCQMD